MKKFKKNMARIGLWIIIIGAILSFAFGWAIIVKTPVPWLGGLLYGFNVAALVMAIISLFFIRTRFFRLITGILGILAGLSGAVIPLVGGVFLLIATLRK